jgi:hypothetical protein
MINYNAYNVVRQAIPTCPVDDQGLMDIANILVGAWSTDLSRLRFIGFRSAAVSAASAFALGTNEIAIFTNVFTSQNFVLNGGTAGPSNFFFGTVWNRFTAGASNMYVQYALFTYE